MLSLHRMCEHPVKMLTMQINQLRGLLYEFSVDLPQGRKKGMAMMVEKLARLDGRLSAMVIVLIRQQIRRIQALDQDIRGAHQRSGRQAEGLTNEPTGEVPCSGARRRDRQGRTK